jgi:hypothetical protein
VAGIGACLESNTLLKAPITTKSNNMVIKNGVILGVELVSGKFSSSGHADGISNTGSKRTSGGLNAWGVMLRGRELRVARGHGVVATEVLDLLQWKGIAREMQPRVDKHRPMACREDESISIEPLRIIRVVAQVLSPQLGADLSTSKRETHVS